MVKKNIVKNLTEENRKLSILINQSKGLQHEAGVRISLNKIVI